MPVFRADQVDAVVWDWIKSFLTDREALDCGLRAVRHKREQENTPTRDRLVAVDEVLADNKERLERLLDLYLSGEFPRELLIVRKTRLEASISGLDRERGDLAAQQEAQLFTAEQVHTIQGFADKVRDSLEAMDDFDTRRRLIEELDVRVTLTLEDEQRVVHARCRLGERRLCAASSTVPSPIGQDWSSETTSLKDYMENTWLPAQAYYENPVGSAFITDSDCERKTSLEILRRTALGV